MQKYKLEIKEISLWAKKFTQWDKLRTIQNSKIISSTYVWLFVVPLYAKFLSKVNDSIRVGLELPFSWQAFFYSSLCFVIGNIIYIAMAPELIKDFKDYGEYLGSRRNLRHLSRYMTEKYKQYLRKIHGEESERKRNYQQIVQGFGITESESSVKKSEEDQFWELYDYLNVEYHYFRYICFTLYATGFLLFSWVIIRNIFWVLTY